MEVVLRGVGHRFADGPMLFRDLTETLLPGHLYAVTGPSGAGKSTLLALLAQWVTPVEGTIVRRDIGRMVWVSQQPHGVPGRSALDHVVLPYLARGRHRPEAERSAAELMRSFGLSGVLRARYSTLSGGQAQRLMLARALAAQPELVLVDEPTAQLDRASAELVNGSLSNLARTRTITVVATHDPQTIAQCTDRIDLGTAP